MSAVTAAALLATALLLVGCEGTLRSRVNAPGGVDASISELQRAGLDAAVNEYFLYRKRAIVTGDIQVLWQRYPDLAEGADREKGINDEARIVESYRHLRPLDVNVDPRRYAPITYQVLGGVTRASVHGLEAILLSDFRESAAELVLAIDLRLGPNRWDVVRTDEVTVSEWNAPSGRP